jgi:hypothetical protein
MDSDTKLEFYVSWVGKRGKKLSACMVYLALDMLRKWLMAFGSGLHTSRIFIILIIDHVLVLNPQRL